MPRKLHFSDSAKFVLFKTYMGHSRWAGISAVALECVTICRLCRRRVLASGWLHPDWDAAWKPSCVIAPTYADLGGPPHTHTCIVACKRRLHTASVISGAERTEAELCLWMGLRVLTCCIVVISVEFTLNRVRESIQLFQVKLTDGCMIA